MANNEEQKETTPLNETPQSDLINPIQTNERNSRNLITWFAIIIAVIATALSIYTIKLNYQLQTKLDDETTNFSNQLTQFNQVHTDTKNQFQQKSNDVQNTLNELKDQVQTTLNQRQYQNEDWLLFKARYYLELAQVNSYWSDNFKTSVALLQQADTLLKQLTDPKIFDIRQAIANEITQINGMSTVDITGLLTQLDAVQMNVNNLTLQTIQDKSGVNTKTEIPQISNQSTWRTRLQSSVSLLEKLVVIRRDNEDIKPLLSPLYEAAVRESIRLNLQEAQWAILNKNQAVYQLALKQAILNLKRVFDVKAQNTAELIKKLNDLQQIQLTPEKPVTDQALPLLNQLIESKNVPAKPATTNVKGDH